LLFIKTKKVTIHLTCRPERTFCGNKAVLQSKQPEGRNGIRNGLVSDFGAGSLHFFPDTVLAA
jgi:hypothetical protein